MTDERTHPSLLDDLPAGEDALGFRPYVEALAELLLDPNTRTPLTLGIFGAWGAGKTSLMRMVQQRLEASAGGDFPVLSVWFNAWLYSEQEALWRAIVSRVVDGVRGFPTLGREAGEALDHLESRLYGPASTGGGHLALPAERLPDLEGATLPPLMGLELLRRQAERTKDTEAAERLELLLADVEKSEALTRRDQIVALDDFRREFERISRQYIEPHGRLAVFVDDLDRCLPDEALKVLQAIKLFLDVPGCVFVLGLDPGALETAARSRYQDETKARDYLQKIIQLPFILPPLEAEPMREYVQSLAPALPDERCAEVFALGLRPNPRQVKRTLNIFLLLSRLVEKREELAGTITPVRLAKLVAIQHAYPDLYDLLRLRPGYLRDLEAFFRAQEAARDGEGVEVELPSLPEALEPFRGRETLRRLLCLLEEEDARFDGLAPLEVRSYITLTRRATPAEAPAARVARRSFEPELVPVPAGPFLMGSDKAKDGHADDDELPQHEVELPAFEIGRYPVTNAEYAAFVEATGRDAPEHWPEGALPEELADHPVVNVSWHDAQAYAAWLREQTGREYRLPSEAEWEKAARGEDGRLWPWGDDWDPRRCNSAEADTGSTTPVGQYSPAGDSPHGCADMAGNVWEWTRSLWGKDREKPNFKYPYVTEDGRENLEAGDDIRRVLRGGSFGYFQWYVRCAARAGSNPSNGGRDFGFRVVVAPGPSGL